MPLERDEGEYAYVGQLILEGIPPYKLAYSMKLPGTYAAYAVILFLLGQTPGDIHIGLLLVNGATIILMFFLARRLFGELAGVVAAAAYAVLSAGGSILGLQAHATHFVVLPAVAGLLVLACYSFASRRAVFWSGALFGLAILMKQPGVFLAAFAALLLAYEGWRERRPWRATLTTTAFFGLGCVLPLGITCLVMALCGVLSKFWFWVFEYARAYGKITSVSEGLKALEGTVPGGLAPAVSGYWL